MPSAAAARWLVARGSANPATGHQLAAEGRTWTWTGPVDLRAEPG